MAKDTKNAVSIDGQEYPVDELTPQQQALLNHVADLDRKLDSARFNVDQLTVGRNAFFELLKQALAEKPELAQAEVILP